MLIWFYSGGDNAAYSLIHNDTDSIVQQTLTKDDGVQLGIDLVLIEDGQNGNGVRGRQGGSKDKTFEQGNVEGFQAKERVDVD